MKTKDSLEDFIRQNRDSFSDSDPGENHLEKFTVKLTRRIRHIISIVPYLIRVSIVTAIIFCASVIVWNSFIRKDRNEISLKNKISLVITILSGRR